MEKSKKVNLTIDSRIISHLGEALIDNEKIALLELIKNASDADANKCSITIDTLFESKYGRGRIIIEDDGSGMNPYILENAFLKIATSFKAEHQKISPKFGRQAQGNKGIGRLALNQLGRFVSVTTKVDPDIISYYPSELDGAKAFGYMDTEEFKNDVDNYYRIDIDWEEYSNSGKTIEEVNLELHTSVYTDKIFTHGKNHGTRIEVLGLKGIEFWRNTQTVREIEQDILEFLNPFIEEKVNFLVKIKLDNIIFRSNKYDINDIENNCYSKASFNYCSESRLLSINVRRSKKYIDFQLEKLKSDLSKRGFVIISEAKIDTYYKKYCCENFDIHLDSLLSLKKDIPNVKAGNFIIEESGDKFNLPGNFKGSIYGYDLRSSRTTPRSFQKVLHEVQGVKLYRNNFRIFPYGDKSNDWLGMSDYNQRTASVIYKQHSTTGFINIDGEENLDKLKELTNRQGLVLDSYGNNFLSLVRDVIYKVIADSDQRFSTNLSFKRNIAKSNQGKGEFEIEGIKFIKKESSVEKIDAIAENLEKDTAGDDKKSGYIKSLREVSKNIKDDIKERERTLKDEEKYLGSFAPIMGATIISETLSHEIIRLSNNIKSYSSNTRLAIANKKIDKAYSNLSRIDSSIKFLLRYASLLDTNSSTRRRKYVYTDIKKQILDILKDTPLLSYGETTANYVVYGEGFTAKIVEDSFRIIILNCQIKLEKNYLLICNVLHEYF